MNINGKDRRFFLSTGAMLGISELCPDKKLGNMKSFFTKDSNDYDTIYFVTHSAVILNKAYEDAEHFKNSDYKQDYLTIEEVQLLSRDDYLILQTSVIEAINEGSRREVETAPDPKSKNAQSPRK